MKIGMIRKGNTLVPMDYWQGEELEKMPEGKPLSVEVDECRNIRNHRRFFAFLNLALDLQDHYTNTEQLRFALFIKAGLCSQVTSHKNGSVSFMPQSMKFEKMGEAKFKEVFKLCLDAFHQMLLEMGRNISEQELMRLVDFE